MDDEWINNPSLSGIDPAKMALLQTFLAQGKGKAPNDMMNFLMSAANISQKKGLQFTPDEMDSIIDVLKVGKSQQEIARMNKMLSLIKMMRMKN